jgi:hypothetical protein
MMKLILGVILLVASHEVNEVSSIDLDIRPKADPPENGLFFVDTSSLPEGTSFYETETLTIQLLADGPTWTLYNYKTLNTSTSTSSSSSAYFSGETNDAQVTISLLRYSSSESTLSALTGIVHERSQNLFYEIRPDYRGYDTVRITDEAELPPLGDPLQPSFLERMTTFASATPITSTWYNRIHNALGLVQRQKSQTSIDVMILWTESSECYMSGLDPGCTRDNTTQTNMEAAVALIIADTNTAMTNSGTNTLLNLVHRQVDSSGYVETRMSQTLKQLKDRDGALDYILELRYVKMVHAEQTCQSLFLLTALSCLSITSYIIHHSSFIIHHSSYIIHHTVPRNEKKADLVQFIVDNRLDSDQLGGIAYFPQKNFFGCWDSALGYSLICAQVS